MSAKANMTISCSIAGKQIYRSFERESDHPKAYVEIPLPVGKEVTDWLHTSGSEAACNLPSGHGYSDGDFDVYWVDDNGNPRIRYGVPGTIVTNALTLNGGDGDDFPITATENIVVSARVTINTYIDGDEADAVCVVGEFSVASETAYCSADFCDNADATVKHMHLPPNEPQLWAYGWIFANPLAGDVIEQCYASNGSATNAATITILVLEDATP